MRIAVVILAAGRSSRLGRPKQLLDLGGEPLLRHTVRHALAAPVDEVVLVLGNAADETSGTWEELIDSDRVVIISDPPQAVRREAAAVPLSPGKPRPSRPPSPNPKPRVADT